MAAKRKSKSKRGRSCSCRVGSKPERVGPPSGVRCRSRRSGRFTTTKRGCN